MRSLNKMPLPRISERPWPAFLLLLILFTSGCAGPPRRANDICAIFEEKPSWYREAKKSRDRWGVPISVMLAIIYQESGFHPRARPPRKKILGFSPGPRPSTSFGYAQALSSTWKNYIKNTGQRGARRDVFSDVVDFVGWYCRRSRRECGISASDAYRLYLAYHEGQNGFNQGTYRSKPWLLKVAAKVRERARLYRRQLAHCREKLEQSTKKSFLFF